MNGLDPSQPAVAMGALRDFRAAPVDPASGRTPPAGAAQPDTRRRELKRRRRFRKLCHGSVCSGFQDDVDDLIRGLEMDPGVNDACLLGADAPGAMVDAGLRDPGPVTLGPDGLRRLLCRSGLPSAGMVREELA